MGPRHNPRNSYFNNATYFIIQTTVNNGFVFYCLLSIVMSLGIAKLRPLHTFCCVRCKCDALAARAGMRRQRCLGMLRLQHCSDQKFENCEKEKQHVKAVKACNGQEPVKACNGQERKAKGKAKTQLKTKRKVTLKAMLNEKLKATLNAKLNAMLKTKLKAKTSHPQTFWLKKRETSKPSMGRNKMSWLENAIDGVPEEDLRPNMSQ